MNDRGEGVPDATTAGRPSGSLESELENVCREITLIEGKVADFLEQQSSLVHRREQLSKEIQARKKRRESGLVAGERHAPCMVLRWPEVGGVGGP